jgi:type II secretory pathway component PulJ
MIEMLVSLTITMIMMLAVVTLFQVMTDSVSGSRALLEAGDRLRACRNRLQADLQGATATMLPPCARKTTKGILKLVRE